VIILRKRGVLMAYVLIFTVLAISVSIGLFFWLQGQKLEFEIGGVQGEVIRSFNDINSEKYYIESNMKKFSEDPINDFLEVPVLDNVIKKDEYILWKQGRKECYPDSWEKIRKTISFKLGDVSFDFVRKDDDLSFEARGNIIYESSDENYRIEHSEEIDEKYLIENFNFDDFINKVEDIAEIENSCKDNETCWRSKFSSKNGFIFNESRDKLFKFEFITPGLEQDITVKVAVDFEEELNLGEEELKC
jgi:hypothetical protein